MLRCLMRLPSLFHVQCRFRSCFQRFYRILAVSLETNKFFSCVYFVFPGTANDPLPFRRVLHKTRDPLCRPFLLTYLLSLVLSSLGREFSSHSSTIQVFPSEFAAYTRYSFLPLLMLIRLRSPFPSSPVGPLVWILPRWVCLRHLAFLLARLSSFCSIEGQAPEGFVFSSNFPVFPHP